MERPGAAEVGRSNAGASGGRSKCMSGRQSARTRRRVGESDNSWGHAANRKVHPRAERRRKLRSEAVQIDRGSFREKAGHRPYADFGKRHAGARVPVRKRHAGARMKMRAPRAKVFRQSFRTAPTGFKERRQTTGVPCGRMNTGR